jgi:hypothetical protein
VGVFLLLNAGAGNLKTNINHLLQLTPIIARKADSDSTTLPC